MINDTIFILLNVSEKNCQCQYQYVNLNLVVPYLYLVGPTQEISLLSLFSVDEVNRWLALRIMFALLISVICLKKLYSNSTCGPLFSISVEFRSWGWKWTSLSGKKLFKNSNLQSIGLRLTLSRNWFMFSLRSVIDSKKEKRVEDSSLCRLSSMISLKCFLKQVGIMVFGIIYLETEYKTVDFLLSTP